MDTSSTPNTLPSGFKRAPKFQVGQVVWSKQGNVQYEIMEQCGVNSWGVPEYLVQDILSKVESYHMEDWLCGIISEPAVCECGAWATYGRDCPDSWHSASMPCPVYKEDK